ncbi:MAG TPA: Crp/Fnr family transcriptional regulator [Candidatus Copromorpha excrementigallinarum]|uniref:Crp/Fnr family transcriptional regulator n=1 Tax=Candidatus Allocopromorpha excrementigallinarum TaxID=2840742 RepID=A0A9D1I2Z1_9FIRM|nr:Crp/Fnr family transcriptional regulator [Candidatus Copromorpha excrementigallinarum]
MRTKQDILSRHYDFWEKLTEEEKNHILESCVNINYGKGETVHRSEERCKGAMTVLKGQLRVYIVSEEGREVTLFRVREGEICVLSASCLMDAIVFDVIIEAVEETESLVIPVQCLHPLMEGNPYVGMELYRTAAERFSDVMWTMQQILFMGADRRVAAFLWDEYVRGGEEISMTHDEVARYIGSAREVVTKVLRYLSEEGAVALGRGKIRITDREKLRKTAVTG